jgi:AbrB family looped-hinge helix DNA binding protein
VHQSIITRKGQTTIPKEIRTFLKLEPNDKIFYLVEGEKVVLKPLRGDILELRGSVPAKDQPTDFDKVLKTVRKKVAKKIVEDH